jgi:hypothetical protein
MLEFLIDNIFVSSGGTLFQQVVDIPMGTNCAPLLADLFLYSYESELGQKIQSPKEKGQRTNNNLQNITHRTRDRATRTPLKTGGEPRCSGRVGSSCSTCDNRGVTLVTNMPT